MNRVNRTTLYRPMVPIIRPGRSGVTVLIFPPNFFFSPNKEKKIFPTFPFFQLFFSKKVPTVRLIG